MTHHLDNIATSGKQNALLTLGRENHVRIFQRHRRGHGDRFFAGRLHVEAHLALALQLLHAVIIGPRHQHVTQAFTQHARIKLGVPLTNRLMVMVQNTNQAEGQVLGFHAFHRRIRPLGLPCWWDHQMGKVRLIARTKAGCRHMKTRCRLGHGISQMASHKT